MNLLCSLFHCRGAEEVEALHVKNSQLLTELAEATHKCVLLEQSLEEERAEVVALNQLLVEADRRDAEYEAEIEDLEAENRRLYRQLGWKGDEE